MRSLQARFNQLSEKNPLWSSHTCFAEAIKHQKFSRDIIHRWFQKLVEKDDYAKSEKKAVLKHLENLTNLPRTTENKAKHHRQRA
jgi:hypothetical protein